MTNKLWLGWSARRHAAKQLGAPELFGARQHKQGVISAFAAAACATGTALAQDEGGVIELEPIKVTGEKTVRSYEETATSVSVFTDEDIENLPGGATLDDITRRLPNVVTSGTGNAAPTVRGVDTTGPAQGGNAFLAGTRPRVTVQVDGRPLSYNEFVFGRTPLWDVERVEVLRGPQTTLQGRNSIAGAIIIDTKDPSFEYEAGARAIIGNYDTRQFSGVVSGPIVKDQLAFRIAADRRDHESFVNVEGDQGYDDANQDDSTNLRAKLLYLPAALPEFSAKLTFNHNDTRQPQVETVEQPFEARVNSGIFPAFDNQSNSGILDLNYFLTENAELRNTSTYSDINVNRLTVPGQGIAEIQAGEFTNETILEYAPTDSRFRGIVGTYYFNASQDDTIDFGGPGVFNDHTKTVALFGEGTYTFFEKLDLTLGGRYENEKRERIGGAGGFINVNLDETFDAFLPKVGLAYRLSDQHTVGATVQRGFNSGGATLNFEDPSRTFVYDEEYVWNYEAFFRSRLLDNRLTVDGNLFYADYDNQQRFALVDPGNPNSGIILNAESVKSYGAEISSTWLPVRQLEVFGALGLLETEIEDFRSSGENFAGNEFARAPSVNASFGALYRPFDRFSIGFDGQYSDEYFSDDQNDPAGAVDSYAVFNGQASYEFSHYRLFAFVTNVFDKDYELQVFPGDETFPTTAQISDPREYGVGLEVFF